MSRITIYDLFPLEEGELLRLDAVDRFIYRKRKVPLWNNLTPISKLLCKRITSTVFQNGLKYGELAIPTARTDSRYSSAIKGKLNDKP